MSKGKETEKLKRKDYEKELTSCTSSWSSCRSG